MSYESAQKLYIKLRDEYLYLNPFERSSYRGIDLYTTVQLLHQILKHHERLVERIYIQ